MQTLLKAVGIAGVTTAGGVGAVSGGLTLAGFSSSGIVAGSLAAAA